MFTYVGHGSPDGKADKRKTTYAFYLGLASCMTAVLLISLLAGCGKSSQSTTAQASEATTMVMTQTFANGIKSLKLMVRKVDTEKGIEILLIPQDANGVLTKIEGTVNIKLWGFPSNMQDAGVAAFTTDDKFIQEWSQMPLTEGDYSPFLGAILFLPYDMPHNLQDTLGVMRVTLETPSGAILSAEQIGVLISASYNC